MPPVHQVVKGAGAAHQQAARQEAVAIWLDPNKTNKHDFYHFWINTDDRDVIRYLKYFTLLSRDEIAVLEAKHAQNHCPQYVNADRHPLKPG